MSAGDVLLFARKTSVSNLKRDPMGTVMCALIHLTTRSRYNHAALDIGDGMMVEATSVGVKVSPIESSDDITVVPTMAPRLLGCTNDPVVPCFATYHGNDLEETLAWAAGRVGWKYGYVNAAICGLRNMWPGLQIKVGNTAICSELVAESLERSGHWFGKDSALVSPGDLAEHFGVSRR